MTRWGAAPPWFVETERQRPSHMMARRDSQVLTQDLAQSTQDLTLGFTYNAASQVLQRTLSNDAYQYAAPAQSKSYVPDGLNRYASVGGVQFLYDARGNLRNNGTRAFTYDLENHLVRVDAAAGSTNATNSFLRSARPVVANSRCCNGSISIFGRRACCRVQRFWELSRAAIFMVQALTSLWFGMKAPRSQGQHVSGCTAIIKVL